MYFCIFSLFPWDVFDSFSSNSTLRRRLYIVNPQQGPALPNRETCVPSSKLSFTSENMINSSITNPNSKELSHESVGCILSKLSVAMRRANILPSADDFRFLTATSQEIGDKRRNLSCLLRGTITELSAVYGTSTLNVKISSDGHDDSLSSLTVDDQLFDKTMETTDEALDYFNRALDNARGIEDAVVPVTGALGHSDAQRLGLKKNNPSALDIDKPQLAFPDYPIDNSDAPFIPPLTKQQQRNDNKKRKQKRLCTDDQNKNNEDDSTMVSQYLRTLYKNNNENNVNSLTPIERPPHPYEEEINKACEDMKTYHNSNNFSGDTNIMVYKPLKETPFTFITTEEQLTEAMKRISKATELAIDLENHSVRSFQGFICLIQISTRREDFIIDALALRGSIHSHLASVFSDPTTVKVLHGADRDVQWLERDFGIYVINMFDTGQAARILKYASAGLAHLLSKFCGCSSQNMMNKKKFQLADWRQRPLPNDMLAYARDDTHYLLYIYDRLRSELVNCNAENKMQRAWERSAEVCKKRHEKINFQHGMARQLAAKHGLGLNEGQLELLEGLYKWRDFMARKLDESLMYVSPLHVLYGIVRGGDKVRSVDGLLQFGFPTGVVPVVIRDHVEEVVMLICDVLDSVQEGQERNVEKKEEKEKVDEDVHADAKYNVENVVVAGGDGEQAKQLCVDPGKLNSPEMSLYNADDDDEDSSDDDEDNKVKVSAADNVSQPSVSVVMKRKSALLGSDSESSSDEQVEENDGNNKVNEIRKEMDTSAVVKSEILVVEASMAMGEEGESGTNEGMSGSEARTAAVSRVHESLAADVTQDGGIVNGDFEVECGMEGKAGIWDGKIEKAHVRVKQEDEDVVEMKSIMERFGGDKGLSRNNGAVVGKRKQLEEEIVKSFDYKQAKRTRRNKEKEQGEEATGFDPMRRLKSGWKQERPKVRKRRRGRGKSMSFSSRK